MERGLSERYNDRVSPVKRHMDHMVAMGAEPGLVDPHLNTMTSDVIKVRVQVMVEQGWFIGGSIQFSLMDLGYDSRTYQHDVRLK